jgi:hypothetical protein
MSFIQRQLDPAEILGEILFGLIMVLTFTLGAALAAGYERGLLLGAIGCNVAWGVIDGVLLVHALLSHAQPMPMTLSRDDWMTGLAVFVLVVAPALPAALPFFVVRDPHLALRLSNALLIALLFAIGWRWARHIELRRWLSGLVLMTLGMILVAIAIALGG